MSAGFLPPGTRIGSYELLATLGQGGVATVYRARHLFLDRQVALKVLHPFLTDAPEFVSRFQDEGRLLARLEHPHIVRVYDAGEAEGVFYLATAFLEGWSLASVVRGPVPLEAALSIAGQVLRALAYAHAQGVVHRDVKPANVMLSPQGHVTLMDLGVARLLDSPGVTLPGIRIGTPFYMAPEQIRGEAVDGRADLYSVGVLLYQMVTGVLPFGGASERVFEGHLRETPPPLPSPSPAWLQAAIDQALAKAPSDRFPDAESFLYELHRRGEAAPQEAVPEEPPHEPVAPLVGSGASPPAAGGAETGFRREDRAVLSLDVAGSTRMKLPGMTTAIQDQFGRFRRYVAANLERHHCLTHLWAGDGLLALFPRAGDAAACAREILGGLSEFNQTLARGRQPIRARLGVHSGSVQMTEGQPLGELVSRTLDYAGHLQKACPPDGLLISEPAYSALADRQPWEHVDELLPEFPFRVYRYAPERTGEPEVPPPAPDSGARLRLVNTGPGGRQEQVVSAAGAVIGRHDPEASSQPEIVIEGDSAVSRRHARILCREDGCFLEDMDSSNGTELNGTLLRPYAPAPLAPGDQIRIGESTTIEVAGVSGIDAR